MAIASRIPPVSSASPLATASAPDQTRPRASSCTRSRDSRRPVATFSVKSSYTASSQVLIRSHSMSVNGRDSENIVAFSSSATVSMLIPARPNISRSTGLPRKTPIEPVIVPGCATITSAGAAMK